MTVGFGRLYFILWERTDQELGVYFERRGGSGAGFRRGYGFWGPSDSRYGRALSPSRSECRFYPPQLSHGYLYAPVTVAILLTAAATAEFILGSHREWPPRRRLLATSSLLLLLASDALGVALITGRAAPNHNPAPAILGLFLTALITFILAFFTAGRFRYMAASAAAVIVVWIGMFVVLMGALSGLR